MSRRVQYPIVDDNIFDNLTVINSIKDGVACWLAEYAISFMASAGLVKRLLVPIYVPLDSCSGAHTHEHCLGVHNTHTMYKPYDKLILTLYIIA